MVDVGTTGTVPLTFRCSTTRQAYLVGDFNQWDRTATPMHPGEDRIWWAMLKLAPGQYEFRYREEGDVRYTDFAACGVVLNRFGLFNSIVDVVAPIRHQGRTEGASTRLRLKLPQKERSRTVAGLTT